MKDVEIMDKALKVFLYLIFIVALVTGINVFINGVTGVPEFQGEVNASVDNELRFLSAFWIGFGFFCLSVAKNFGNNRQFVPYIALLFFISGVGRLMSLVFVGQPIGLFVAVMAVELVLPLVMVAIHFFIKSKAIVKT